MRDKDVEKDSVDTSHVTCSIFKPRDQLALSGAAAIAVWQGSHCRGSYLMHVWDAAEKRGGAWMDEVVGRSKLMALPGQDVRLPVAHMVRHPPALQCVAQPLTGSQWVGAAASSDTC